MTTRSYQIQVYDLKYPSIYRLTFTDRGIAEITWHTDPETKNLQTLTNQEGQIGENLTKFIDATWTGDTAKAQQLLPQIPAEIISGTPFQRQVWQSISLIPLGQTQTYTQIAVKLNNSNAVRAVGSACGRNPLPLLIPCHRVTATHGLGGFGGGLERKRKLLHNEQVQNEYVNK